MLKRLTTLSIFLISVLIFFVSMLGVDEAFAAPNPPNSFTVSNVTSTSFTLSWSGGPGFGWSWTASNLRHREKGTTSWSEEGAGSYKSADLSGLKPATTYEYQVANQGITLIPIYKWSGWSSTQTATTNRPPATNGSIPNQTFKTGDAAVTLDMSNYFTDPDSDTLTYTEDSDLTSVSGSTLTITPSQTPTTATVTVTASDVDRSATQSFTITVNAKHVPEPRGAIGDPTLKVGSSDWGINVSFFFKHADGWALTYSATSSDTSIATVSMSGEALTITAVAAGSATVTVTATDGYNSATQTSAVTVEANSPPVAVGSIPDQSVRVGSPAVTVNVRSYFSDPDGHALTYSATSSDTTKSTVSVLGSTLTIDAVATGSVTITVTVTDTANATATQTISVSVLSNRLPVRVGYIPTQTVSLTESAVTVDVSSYFSDPDGNPLTYSTTSSNPSRATVSVSEATLTIDAVATGWTTITVNAIDNSNAGATQTFSVNVISNRAPISVGTIPTQSVRVGGTDATFDVSSYFSDPDGNPLTYSATSSNTNKATVSVSDATLTITAVAAGWLTISVKATDTYNASRTRSFSVQVLASNTLNPVGSIPAQTVLLSGTGTATVDVSSYFSSLAGDTLVYSATSSDTEKATVSVSDATVTITGVAAGSATISVEATINDASATQTISVTVYANRAPTPVGTIPTITVKNSRADQFDVSSYFSDPDGNVLTYTASTSDNTIAEVSVGTGTNSMTLYVLANGLGTATITVTATDPSNATATQTFSATVIPQTADAVPGLSTTEQLLLGQLLTYDTIVFNELHNSSDDANDWLELRNVSNVDIPLDNWQLTVQTGSETAVIPFPAGSVIPAGEVLLIANTEIATAAVVVESFALPQTEFALILRSPTAFGDLAGNYYEDERPETAPELTADTVWERVQATTSGYRAEAWAVSTHRNGLGSPGYQPSALAGDLNHDGLVNILDLVLVASQFGTTGITAADLNGDNTVNIQDLVLVANASSNVSAAPTAKQSAAATVNTWLQLARQNASSTVQTSLPKGFSYARGIQVLEQLVRVLTPETTALLANYPNPFNPETWIPYQLSKPADVTVTIYASEGSVVRTLALGHQDAGLYKNRTQAAYWDGRNAFGETVASGVYFYTLTADEFTATRKMLILK